MLEPDPAVTIEPGAAVVTIHALEQIGDRHAALIDWLIAARPSVVVHYEPIVEFYDPRNVTDYLSAWYSEQRRYLNGFWPALAARRDAGDIEIVQAHRPGLGGVYHEASVIVWRLRRPGGRD
jgi:hypothetical protein